MSDHEKNETLPSSNEPLSTITSASTPSNSIAETQDDSGCGGQMASCAEECPGFQGYLAVFGSFVSLLVTFGQMNAFGTFQTWYSNHQLSQLSQSTISWIGSFQLLIFFLAVRVTSRDLLTLTLIKLSRVHPSVAVLTLMVRPDSSSLAV
jgi:hypothetical protein